MDAKNAPLAKTYRAILSRNGGQPSARTEVAESFSVNDHGAAPVDQTMEKSREFLCKQIEELSGNRADLKMMVDDILKAGKNALNAVYADDDNFLSRNPKSVSCLEVIVRTDGSRPSFVVQNGKVNKNSSPIGEWESILDQYENEISHAVSSVGRVDVDGVPMGTGFLIHEKLVLTNRHVLQAIATKENDGRWLVDPKATIDFGLEFRGKASHNKCRFKQVLYSGPSYIDPEKIDHNKLDLALMEVEPGPDYQPTFFYFDSSTDWATGDSYIFTIGYPANPGFDGLRNYNTLLEQIFKSTFDCKRFAPGKILNGSPSDVPGRLRHDATTLGGNSGSVIVVATRATVAAGLHYGGTLKAPRENWGHVLGEILTKSSGTTDQNLKQYLEEWKVKLVDRF